MRSSEHSAWRSVCLRVHTGSHFVWLHVIMRLCDDVIGDVTDDVIAGGRRIVCINQLIDHVEAQLIRACATDLFSPAPPLDVGVLRGAHGALLDGLLDGGGPRCSKRRMTPAIDDWSAGCSPPTAKMSRQTVDQIFDDACLMSMPSPPLSNPTAAAADWCSVFPATGDGFLGAIKTEVPRGPPFIPDSLLTPSASPCSSSSFSASPAPDWSAADQPQTFSVDDLSFFDHVARHEQRHQTAVKLRDDKLPELDLPTVTSYLDCLEHSSTDPLMHSAGQQGSIEYTGRTLPISVGVRLYIAY